MVIQISRRHKIDLAFGAALILFLLTAIFSFLSIRGLLRSQVGVQATEQTLSRLAAIPKILKDAEAAQRGFLLTHETAFLDGYDGVPDAVNSELSSLDAALEGDTVQLRRLALLRQLTQLKLASMNLGIEAGRQGGFAAGAEIVRTGGGRQSMESISSLVSEMERHEFALLQQRQVRESGAARRAILLVLLSGGLAILIVAGSRQSMVAELRGRETAERKLAEHNEAIRELYQIASSQELDVDRKINALIDIGQRRLGMSVGVLADVAQGRYTVEAVRDPTGRIREGDVYAIDEDAPGSSILASDHPVLIANADQEGDGVWRTYPLSGFRSYIGMPVTLRGTTVGTLSFADATPRTNEFTDVEVDFSRLVAQWIGQELERVEAAATLQQREERYRVLVESASDVIFTIDVEGRFTYVNPAGARSVGFSEAELRGMDSLELVRQDHREEFREALRAQVLGKHGSVYYEVPVVTKEGRNTWLGLNMQLLHSEGELVGMQAVARDITRQLEVELMKDTFLSVVSHELRTPLTAIRGSLGLLASGKMGMLAERGQRMLEIAAQNTDRLVRLINDLLDIEKIESGTAAMEFRLTSLGEIVTQAVDEMRSLADGAEVTIDAAPTDVELVVDPDRLLQVLTNLISNAVKFSGPGQRVTITIEESPSEVLVAVADEGRGIPAEKREAIFDRFQQVDSGDARQKGGTGLGLPIARSIVQQHGGQLRVESELGRGSTFTFSLPRPAALHTETGRSVLVCEDDPTVATYVREILTRSGFEVIHVSTGTEIVSAATTMRPSVILLDLSLPGISGIEALHRLRTTQTTRNTPVVVMTAMNRRESEITLDEVSGWVPKPIDRVVLLQTIDAALEKDLRFNVLIVEDDDDLAGVFLEMLRTRGLTSRRAKNGSEAIEISRGQVYDLLLLDPGLPGVDGFALVDWLRRHNLHRTLPVLVYSARDLDDTARDRLKLGPTEFMTKSRVSPEQLEQRIAVLFGQATRAQT